MTFIATYEGALNALAAMQSAINNFYVRLFTAPTVLSDAVTLGSITQAAFMGYAAVNPAWGAAFLDGSNVARSNAPTAVFHYTDVSGTALIYGYYLTDPGNTLLFGAELFPAAVTLSPTLNTLSIDTSYTHFPQA